MRSPTFTCCILVDVLKPCACRLAAGGAAAEDGDGGHQLRQQEGAGAVDLRHPDGPHRTRSPVRRSTLSTCLARRPVKTLRSAVATCNPCALLLQQCALPECIRGSMAALESGVCSHVLCVGMAQSGQWQLVVAEIQAIVRHNEAATVIRVSLAPCRDGAERPEKLVVAEIQAIIRQITASVTFLPLLQDRCASLAHPSSPAVA